MRSKLFALLATIVALVIVPCALAQSDIDLGMSQAGAGIQFINNDGAGDFTMNFCGSISKTGVCTLGALTGPATGEGVFAGDNGFYFITGSGITATLTSAANCVVCTWSLSGPNLGFQFWTGANETGTELLAGTFQLVSMTQTKNVNGINFNQTVTLNFTPTGGALASFFTTSGGSITLNIEFTTAKSLATIPKGASRFGWIVNGTVTPTPEPGTMALLGSGFLLIGGYLRKKYSA